MDHDAIDPSSEPDGDLVKEVYAHFGLCMYFAQVFETGLINILTALETAASPQPIRQTFDDFYTKHETLTFGNLMKGLGKHSFLPADLETEVRSLKSERDHLAHRFFRDHDIDFMSVGGCNVMIESLTGRVERFRAVDSRVSELEDLAMTKIGFNADTLAAATEEIKGEMMEEARTRYRAKP